MDTRAENEKKIAYTINVAITKRQDNTTILL